MLLPLKKIVGVEVSRARIRNKFSISDRAYDVSVDNLHFAGRQAKKKRIINQEE